MEASLTKQDIGRAVVYAPPFNGLPKETGVITSFNSNYVFVRFGSDTGSKACRYQNLEFEHTTFKTYSCHFSRVTKSYFDFIQVGAKVDELCILKKTYKNCEILHIDKEAGTFRFSYD